VNELMGGRIEVEVFDVVEKRDRNMLVGVALGQVRGEDSAGGENFLSVHFLAGKSLFLNEDLARN
jgi:hypothetical protein